MCQETVFWALIATKRLQLQGDNGPWPPTRALPWTRCIHDFHAFIIWLTSTSTGYSRRYIITTRQSVWRGGYDAIGYRPGCFSENAGIPAITKLGDFLKKTLKNTQGGREIRLVAARVGCRLITGPHQGNNLDLTSSQRRIMCDERKERV